MKLKLTALAMFLITIIGFSAAATASDYSTDIFKVEGVCMDGNASGINNVNYSRGEDDSRMVEFMGGIESSTPCQEINHTIERENGRYTLDIVTKPANAENRTACVQCTGEVRYHAYFRADQPFELDVRHNGQTVDILAHNETDSDNSDNIDGDNNETNRSQGQTNLTNSTDNNSSGDVSVNSTAPSDNDTQDDTQNDTRYDSGDDNESVDTDTGDSSEDGETDNDNSGDNAQVDQNRGAENEEANNEQNLDDQNNGWFISLIINASNWLLGLV